MASNRYAPEGSYASHHGADETGRYGAWDGYGRPVGPAGQCGSYGTYGNHTPYESYGPYEGYGQYAAQYGGGQYDNYSYGQQDGYSSHAGYGRQESYGPCDSFGRPYAAPPAPAQPQGWVEPVEQHDRPEWTERPEQAAHYETDELDLEPWYEWNPTEESILPVRGKHRVAKQRSSRGMARSGAVLGVGMIAAVSAGGLATAKDKGPTSISIPDLSSAKQLPGVSSLLSDEDGPQVDEVANVAAGQAPLTQAGLSEDDTAAGRTDAGEAMRNRIMAQAEQQQNQADASAREAAGKQAAERAEAQAAKEHAEEIAEETARERKEAAEKRAKAEAARLAELARSFKLPVSSYDLTSVFGEAGSMWANNHTGLDFAAPSGTPIKAIHGGTVKEAGWAGSFGYRTILELDDGTEL
ncbi:MAG: M23 family metallopeptidase, partial [Streptomyces sp.]